jgi:hypothetical protein
VHPGRTLRDRSVLRHSGGFVLGDSSPAVCRRGPGRR